MKSWQTNGFVVGQSGVLLGVRKAVFVGVQGFVSALIDSCFLMRSTNPMTLLLIQFVEGLSHCVYTVMVILTCQINRVIDCLLPERWLHMGIRYPVRLSFAMQWWFQ